MKKRKNLLNKVKIKQNELLNINKSIVTNNDDKTKEKSDNINLVINNKKQTKLPEKSDIITFENTKKI